MDQRIAVTIVAGLLGVTGAYALFTVWEDGVFCEDMAWACPPDDWGAAPADEAAAHDEPGAIERAAKGESEWIGVDPIALAIVTIGLLALATGFYIWTKRPM